MRPLRTNIRILPDRTRKAVKREAGQQEEAWLRERQATAKRDELVKQCMQRTTLEQMLVELKKQLLVKQGHVQEPWTGEIAFGAARGHWPEWCTPEQWQKFQAWYNAAGALPRRSRLPLPPSWSSQ